jgi:hypothetical protein
MHRTRTYAVLGLIALFVAVSAGAQLPGTRTLPSAATAPTLKGEPGDKGPRGDKGLPGDKGPTGDKGPSGGHTIRIVRVVYAMPGPSNKVYTVGCAPNEYVAGGGYNFNASGGAEVMRNAPTDNGQAWSIFLNNTLTVPVNVTVHAVCISGF